MSAISERIPAIQEALAAADVDGWLLICFQQNDPISLTFCGLDGKGLVSRRHHYFIPRQGEPRKLVHKLETWMLDHLPGEKVEYLRWQELEKALPELLAGCERVAAQVQPGIGLPTVSRMDVGTADFLRGHGIELVSSADLVQRFAAVWTPEQLESHRRAAVHLRDIVHQAFEEVGNALRDGRAIDEHTVQQWIMQRFDANGLVTHAPPIVGVNAHSADPHYEPTASSSSPIQKGDFLLIDLWAREKGPGTIFADITWCGVCAPEPTDRQQEIFAIVRDARDAAVDFIQSRYPDQIVRGFEVDDACRKVIDDAGYGEFFFHRTGHSIDTNDHGQGANIDNLETHDTRPLIEGTGFSIEPGIYLPDEFGVRLEINVALTADGVEVTGGDRQMELLRLL